MIITVSNEISYQTAVNHSNLELCTTNWIDFPCPQFFRYSQSQTECWRKSYIYGPTSETSIPDSKALVCRCWEQD